MFNVALTPALPPNVVRFPRIFPESLFRGATPVRALISRRLSFPCSGSSAISDATVISPTPFTLPISLACSWKNGKRKLTAVCSHQTRIGNLDAHLI